MASLVIIRVYLCPYSYSLPKPLHLWYLNLICIYLDCFAVQYVPELIQKLWRHISIYEIPRHGSGWPRRLDCFVAPPKVFGIAPRNDQILFNPPKADEEFGFPPKADQPASLNRGEPWAEIPRSELWKIPIDTPSAGFGVVHCKNKNEFFDSRKYVLFNTRDFYVLFLRRDGLFDFLFCWNCLDGREFREPWKPCGRPKDSLLANWEEYRGVNEGLSGIIIFLRFKAGNGDTGTDMRMTRSIPFISPRWFGIANDIACPAIPARPVRPMRCT